MIILKTDLNPEDKVSAIVILLWSLLKDVLIVVALVKFIF